MGIKRIECINGLEYSKVMFRNELADLVRDALSSSMQTAPLSSRVDYIKSIDVNSEGVFIVNYMSSGREFCYYLNRYNIASKKISNFIKTEKREYILKELGIF